MIIKFVAYGCLGLAILNTAEIIGLVEPGRYLSGLPRWDITSFSPAARQWIGHANNGIGMARSGYAMARDAGSRMGDATILPDGLSRAIPENMDAMNDKLERALPGGLHFSRTNLSGSTPQTDF